MKYRGKYPRRIHCLLFFFTVLILITGNVHNSAALNVGDTIPDFEVVSLEGLPVSFRPPQNRVMIIFFWDETAAQSEDRIKNAITAFKRFHNKGLNAVGILSQFSEEGAESFANQWNIPWIQILDESGGEKSISESMGVSQFPNNMIVDHQGKILDNDLQGEELHESIAESLNISLEEVPLPEPPEEKPEVEEEFRFSPPTVSKTDSVRDDVKKLLGETHERDQVEECKKNLRKISLALTAYRMDHNDELPNWLSGLYPDYLQDETILLCPADPTQPEKYEELIDPKMTCSFVYQFAPVKVGARNYREWKTFQLEDYGDKVPVVRCFKFSNPLNLTYGGEIYFSEQTWQNKLIYEGQKTLGDPDAKVRKNLLRIAYAIDKYKEEKEEFPNRLQELHPDYIEDSALLNNPVTNEQFEYLFSSENPETREKMLSQMKKYEAYTPIIRMDNVLKNNRVINLACSGEIYESGQDWQDLFPSEQDSILTESGKLAVSSSGVKSFFGIGAKLLWDEKNNQGFHVLGFTSDSPAKRAGLKKGDLIYSVSEERLGQHDSELDNIDHALNLLRSPKESQVTLAVYRPEKPKPVTLSFKRSLISWSNSLLKSKVYIAHPDKILPIRGSWDIFYGHLKQPDSDVRLPIVVFEPFVKKGEINIQVRVLNGDEGIRLLFGYSSPDEYYSWNVGGWNNTRLEIEKWMGLYHNSAHILCHTVPDFTLKQRQWHEIRLAVDGDQHSITGYVDDEEVIHYETPHSFTGRFGLATWKTQAEFQDIKIIGEN